MPTEKNSAKIVQTALKKRQQHQPFSEEDNDPKTAQGKYDLGYCYEHGQNMQKNMEEAVRLYELAALEGLAIAQFHLGRLHESGTDVAQDMELAIHLYTIAAGKGLAIAQYHLGTLYQEGKGVPQSRRRAVELYQQAAHQGYAVAQYYLGVCCEHGHHGVGQDIDLARGFYGLAAKQGHKAAKKALKKLIRKQISEKNLASIKEEIALPPSAIPNAAMVSFSYCLSDYPLHPAQNEAPSEEASNDALPPFGGFSYSALNFMRTSRGAGPVVAPANAPAPVKEDSSDNETIEFKIGEFEIGEDDSSEDDSSSPPASNDTSLRLTSPSRSSLSFTPNVRSPVTSPMVSPANEAAVVVEIVEGESFEI